MADLITSMPLRRARVDGLAVSALGLGCMGMSEFYGPSDDAVSRGVLDAALEAGVRFFDTADVYGHGHNENLVGGHLRDHPLRREIVLATKGGILRDPNDPARRGVDTSPAYLREAVRRSQDRLRTPIDLYYLHRVAQGGAQVEASMEVLADLLAEGAIRAVGLSEVDTQTIRRAHTALKLFTNGQHGITAVQTEYSLMTRVVETSGVRAMCDDLGILLVAYSPISRGLLAGAAFEPEALEAGDFRCSLPRFMGGNLQHNRALAREVDAVAAAHGATSAQVALAWVLSRGPHVVPIPGTRRLDRLRDNMAAWKLVLSEEALMRLDAVFRPGVTAGERYTAAAMKIYQLAA